MRDRVLLYAIGISFVAHLAAVCVVGRTSASRVGARDVSKPHQFVSVDLLQEKSPEKAAVQPRPVPPPTKPRENVKPPRNFAIEPPEPPRPSHSVRPGTPRPSGARPTTSTQPAGNPGSPLNTGTASSGGDMSVPRGGNTGIGSVGGTGRSNGQGSGDGPGVGPPDPPRNADPGPGTRPAPAPVIPPPPKMVSVKVCEESGLLPGEHCKRTDRRSFEDGKEPTRTCNKCKAPEPPAHVNRLADSAVPVLVSGPKPRIPDSLDEGLSLSATVEFTVEANGSVSGARMSKSSGHSDLDRSIITAVSQRKYRPAVQDGVARRCKISVPFSFRT